MGALNSRDQLKEDGIVITDWWEESVEKDFDSVVGPTPPPTKEEEPTEQETEIGLSDASLSEPEVMVAAFEESVKSSKSEEVTQPEEKETRKKWCCRWF